MLYRLLKKIYQYLNGAAVHGTGNLEMPLEAQKEFLKRFDEPADDYQRSYYKYKCFTQYCYYGRSWQLFFFNAAAMLIYPFLHAKLRRRGKSAPAAEEIFDAVIENVPRLPNTDVIPDEVLQEYPKIKDITEMNYASGYLSDDAEEICRELKKRYFWSFYFRLITMLKLGQFSMYLGKYKPKAIAFYSVEREFAGPLQTKLCEMQGAKYISFMHGDYLYALCFAFQRYSLYYTWDEAYNRMFESLRCDFPMQVYNPKKLQGIAKKLDDHECSFFATYYFSAETRACAERIHEVFECFMNAGLKCKIRPHPRFSDVAMLRKVFSDMEMENTSEYSLEKSIEDSLYIVGLNTTVLSQAYFSGKNVVIDDVSKPEEYRELGNKGYIMLNRPHRLLSDLAADIKNNCPYDTSYKFKM